MLVIFPRSCVRFEPPDAVSECDTVSWCKYLGSIHCSTGLFVLTQFILSQCVCCRWEPDRIFGEVLV
jgi:hypothetical protein